MPRPWEWESLKFLGLGPGNDVSRGAKRKMTQKDREFARRRWQFFGVVAVGVLGWGFGTGAFPLPGRLGRLLQRRRGLDDDDEDEEDGEWVVEEEDEDDEEIVIDL